LRTKRALARAIRQALAFALRHAKSTIKQKTAAVRMLFDFLVVRQITQTNPAQAVRGPKYLVKKGKTPVWSCEDAKAFLDSIPTDSLSGLQDRALIAAML
jgi:site-specific recombinase XerD